MKIILMLVLSLFILSCTKAESKENKEVKKTETSTVKSKKVVKKVKVFDIKSECSVCHDLPKFAEKEKDYLEKKLDFHRKERRINMNQKEYDALKKRILDQAKK